MSSHDLLVEPKLRLATDLKEKKSEYIPCTELHVLGEHYDNNKESLGEVRVGIQ